MIALLIGTALGGQFVLQMHAASEAKVPVLGWQWSVTDTVALVRVQEDGTWEHVVCDVIIRDRTPLARTIMPEALVRALPPTRARMDVLGDAMTVDLGTARLGFSEGALPDAPQAANLVDHEGDGRPGATVVIAVVGLGDVGVDVVHESHAVLHGTRAGDGWHGLIETVALRQHVISADHRLLAGSPVVRPDPTRSTFSLVPTQAETCAAISPG